MAKENIIEKIYNYQNGLLHSKVARMFDQGDTLNDIIDFIEEYTNGTIKPSIGTLHNYKKKYEESVKNNKDFADLVDLRKKTGDNIRDLRPKEHGSLATMDDYNGNNEVYEPKEDRIVSSLQVLERIIKLGNNTLNDINAIDVSTLLKAIDAHTKITGASNGGLMLSGLQQIALQQKAYESAMAEVVAKYIPKEQQEDLFADLKLAENEFYDNLDLTKEGRAAKEMLDKLGISM